jgi:preprotein translocase subunit SecG
MHDPIGPIQTLSGALTWPTLGNGFWLSAGTGILVALFLVSAVLLILIVLIQKPQGGGLAGAFGSGAGSGQTAFGARTGDALTVATVIFFIVFMLSAAVLIHFIELRRAPVAPSVPALQSPEAPPGTPPGTAPGTTPVTVPVTPPANLPPGAGTSPATAVPLNPQPAPEPITITPVTPPASPAPGPSPSPSPGTP